MAVRILTGILMTSASEGSATIHFHPHRVEGDAVGVSLYELGPARGFQSRPGTHVGLRELEPDAKGAKIDDRGQNERLLELAWSGARELSYLIVGEVDGD
jgi:hypothetical protein